MPACKYCGQETGGSMFCQNCGAKVEAQPEAAPEPEEAPAPEPPEPETEG